MKRDDRSGKPSRKPFDGKQSSGDASDRQSIHESFQESIHDSLQESEIVAAIEHDIGSFAHEVRMILDYLALFVRRPVEMIKHTPDLSWKAVISLQIATALTSGVLLGAFTHSFFDFLLGLVVLPITSLLSSFILSSFLFYFFSLFRSTYLDFRRLYTIMVFANLAFFLIHVSAGFIPPMDLIGFGATCLLLVVGLSEQFSQSRQLITKLIGTIYLAFVLIWIAGQIRLNGSHNDPSQHVQPKTMDELERESR